MEQELLQRITIDPEICFGKRTIRRMRYPVAMIIDLVQSGMTIAEILADYPNLEEDDIRACLLFDVQAQK